jgi:hypothetical protein
MLPRTPSPRPGLIVAIAGVVVACAPAAVTPSPTPIPTATATPTPAQTSGASIARPTATPLGAGRYASAELGYSVDLPPGWRRATCSAGIRSTAPMSASEFFVNMPEAEEILGLGLRAVSVRVEDAQGRAPLAWLESGKVVGQEPLRYEAASVDGKPGARAVFASSGETIALVVGSRGWIYAIEKGGPVLDAETETQMSRILPTLRLLEDATLGRATPTAAPRSAQSVAAGIADGFTRMDVAALSEYMAPCVTVGAIPGDAVSRSRAGYAKELQTQLQSGVTVRVQAQPIETDQYLGSLVRSTWSRPGQPEQRVDLVLRADGERWSWSAAFSRAFP